MLGDKSHCWSVFQHKHNKEPGIVTEGNIMHGKILIGFKYWTLQKMGWHDTQVMLNLKPSMGDASGMRTIFSLN